jgi:hypothetical protein
MAVNLSPIGGVAAQFLDNSGNVLSGGKIFTYAAGTTTPQATYTSAGGTTALANPIILDAAGRVPTGEIWLTDGLQYKFIIKTSTDVQIGSYDNIRGINSNFVNYTNSQEIQTATAGQTVFTLTTMQYQPGTRSLSVFVDGVNQYGPGALYAYEETSSTVVTFTSGLNAGASVKFTTSAINASFYGSALQVSFEGFNNQVGNVQDLADADGSDWVGFDLGGTSAVARSVQAKLRDFVNAKDFGAVGDGVADDTAALQAAINYATANKKAVLLSDGQYKITTSLIIGPWNGTSWAAGWASMSLIGDNYSYAVGLGPEILPTFNDKPAIIIQNARGVIIQNISIIGQNTILNTLLANFSLMMVETNFVVGGARDSRYSPYAAICIDPFGTSVPPDGGYPGLTSYYASGAAGSSLVIIDNTSIRDFVVGIMITPNAQTVNAENILFRGNIINGAKSGVAVGQAQSRAVIWQGGTVGFTYYGFDTASYGQQQGPLPNIVGANMAGKYLFNVIPNYGTPPIIQNVHAESFASIGNFYGPAASQQPVTFISCSFNFADFSIGGATKVYADSVYSSTAPTKFIGCSFNGNVFDGPFRMYTTLATDFDVCTFTTFNDELPLWRSSGANALQFDNLTFRDCVLTDDFTRGAGLSGLSDDNAAYYFNTVSGYVAPYGARVRLTDTNTNSQRMYWNANIPTTQTETTISATQSITVGTNGLATMTVPDGTLVRVGDAVISLTSFTPQNTTLPSTYNPIGIVTSVVGNDVTFSGVPQNFISGTYSIKTAWWPRFHLSSTGDVSSGSTSILNVTNPTTWKVGNKIKGTGITVGAYVTNVSGTTLTISKAATATNAGVRLFDADLYYAAGTVF